MSLLLYHTMSFYLSSQMLIEVNFYEPGDKKMFALSQLICRSFISYLLRLRSLNSLFMNNKKSQTVFYGFFYITFHHKKENTTA